MIQFSVGSFLTLFPSLWFPPAAPHSPHPAAMRRFSSEGSLLDLDFLPWKRVGLKSPDHQENKVSGSCKPYTEEDELEGGSAGLAIPELEGGPGKAGPTEARRKELSRKRSISVENLDQQGRQHLSRLSACVISEGCRTYSDGQLALTPQGNTDSMGREELSPSSPSTSSSPFFFRSKHNKPKTFSARLHLRSLFGQVGLGHNPPWGLKYM